MYPFTDLDGIVTSQEFLIQQQFCAFQSLQDDIFSGFCGYTDSRLTHHVVNPYSLGSSAMMATDVNRAGDSWKTGIRPLEEIEKPVDPDNWELSYHIPSGFLSVFYFEAVPVSFQGVHSNTLWVINQAKRRNDRIQRGILDGMHKGDYINMVNPIGMIYSDGLMLVFQQVEDVEMFAISDAISQKLNDRKKCGRISKIDGRIPLIRTLGQFQYLLEQTNYYKTALVPFTDEGADLSENNFSINGTCVYVVKED